MSQHLTVLVRSIIDRLAQDDAPPFNPDQHSREANGQFISMGNSASKQLRQSIAIRASGKKRKPIRQTVSPKNHYDPVLNTVAPKTGRVPIAVLEEAQAKLVAGDRGGAYLTLYRELGNEQLLIQAQITTYTGIWGSGALTGNAWAKSIDEKVNLPEQRKYKDTLDEFSWNIDQGAIGAICDDIRQGGTGRISDDDFQHADRSVWNSKGLANLFPGNSQFLDFIVGNHPLKEGGYATFSHGTWNAITIGLRRLMPSRGLVAGLFDFDKDGRNVAHLVGKRPAEFANNSRYTITGGAKDRFITVYDNRTGFVEAFYDKSPLLGVLPLVQLPNVPLDSNSLAYQQRQVFYNYLGANQHNSGER